MGERKEKDGRGWVRREEGKGREGRLCSIAQTLLLECRVNLMLISIIYIPALHSQLASCVGCMVFHSIQLVIDFAASSLMHIITNAPNHYLIFHATSSSTLPPHHLHYHLHYHLIITTTPHHLHYHLIISTTTSSLSLILLPDLLPRPSANTGSGMRQRPAGVAWGGATTQSHALMPPGPMPWP